MKRGGRALAAPADSASPATAAHRRARGLVSGNSPRSRQEPPSTAGAGVPFPPDTLVRINGSRAKLRVLEVKDGTARLVDSAKRIRWRPVDELRRVP